MSWWWETCSCKLLFFFNIPCRHTSTFPCFTLVFSLILSACSLFRPQRQAASIRLQKKTNNHNKTGKVVQNGCETIFLQFNTCLFKITCVLLCYHSPMPMFCMFSIHFADFSTIYGIDLLLNLLILKGSKSMVVTVINRK